MVRPSQTFYLCFLLLLLTSSCAGVRKMAVGSSASLIYQASEEIETERNWELFKQAVPGNLKLLEGLLHVNPNSRPLLVSVLKAYVGYAFAIHETLHLEEQLSGSRQRPHLEQAIDMYSKALSYGWRYLALEGISYSELIKATRQEGGVPRILEGSLSKRSLQDREAVMFTAQALGSLINLQREDMILVSQLPVAKGMFDWVCVHDPHIHNGACGIFYGAYEAGRPAMLGGNPEEGKRQFLEAIEAYPANWLVPLSFIQFYALPLYDEDTYQEWKPRFKKWQAEFAKEKRWQPIEKPVEASRVSLYRAVALKRFEIIEKFEKELF